MYQTVQAQQLRFCSSVSALLLWQQDESVQQQYEAEAQDPSMSRFIFCRAFRDLSLISFVFSLDFADTSAHMIRSFVNTVTDQPKVVVVVMYAVKASKGLLVIVYVVLSS